MSRVFRDAVLKLAREHPFARQLANSGRLSVPAVLHESVLNTPDTDNFAMQMVPGASCCDAPVEVEGESGWLLPRLGQQFAGLLFCGPGGIDPATQVALRTLQQGAIALRLVVVLSDGASKPEGVPSSAVVLNDIEGLAAQRYDVLPGTFYLIRPDQHVCARWRKVDAAQVAQALRRALCVAGTA